MSSQDFHTKTFTALGKRGWFVGALSAPPCAVCAVLYRLAPSCAVLRCLRRLAPSAPAVEVAKICKSESWCEMMRNGARRCETVRYMARWCDMVRHGATWCDMVQTVRMAQLYPEPPKVVNLQFGSPFSVGRSPASSLWPWVGAQNGQMKAHNQHKCVQDCKFNVADVGMCKIQTHERIQK